MESLNVHFFDGQLKNIYEIFSQDFSRVRNLKEEKLTEFEKLREEILAEKNNQSIINLDIIINTFKNGGMENYDASNNVYACDILYLICELINNSDEELKKEYISLLISQLEEMSGGLCPPGRTTRLFQVLTFKLNDYENS